MNFDSIIFDMDGTLWDAVDLYAESWNIYFQENNINQRVEKKFLVSLMGLEEEIYLSKVLPDHPIEKSKDFYREVIQIQYDLIKKRGGIIFEGVTEGLNDLSKRYKLFIVSNCPEFTIRYFTKTFGIDSYIQDSLSHGENYKSKCENIREIIKINHLGKPVYVGDTDSDRIQSEKAGVPFIFMEYGFGTCQDYLLKFHSFKEFTAHMLNEVNSK